MKEKTTRVPNRAGVPERVGPRLTRAGLKRRQQELALQDLQKRMLAELLVGTDPALREAYHRAATEAAAVASLTPFPQFFFPALFEEKVAWADRYWARQRHLLQRQTGELQAA